jgi:peptide/nickel transport system substrate-binding protein
MFTKKVVYVALAVVMVASLLVTSVVSAAPPQQEEATYTVKLGDNLWTLAEKYLGSGPAYHAIVAATNAKHGEDATFAYIENPDLIHPGWKLVIPSAEEAAALLGKPKAKSITISFFQEPDSLNPMYSGMWFADLAMELIHGGLWTWDENNDFLPELALEVPTKENGGISEDGRTITVKLRQGVKWHDGVEVTSADVKFTWEMFMDERNTPDTRYGMDMIESIDTPDDYTVVIQYPEPYAGWWVLFCPMLNGYVLPKHVLEPVLEEDGTLDGADYNRAPIGFGPFKFVEWMSGDHITFEKNTDYWRGEPKLDRIFIKIVESREVMLAALETGEIDVGVYLLFPNIPQVEEMDHMHLVNVAAGWFELYWFNLREGLGHPALQDVKVRRAIAEAIDRQEIIDTLLLGATTPARTFWDSSYYENTAIQAYPFDPENAKKLLDEAGWTDTDGDGVRDKDGVKLSLRHATTAGNQLREDVQLVVQQMLADVGIEMVIQNTPSDVFFGSYADGGPIATGEYDMCGWEDGAFPDPDVSYYFICDEIPTEEYPDGGNWSGYCFPELDELMYAQATETDPVARKAIYDEIQQFIYDNVLFLPMWDNLDINAIHNRMKDFKYGPWIPYFNSWEWDVTQ